MEILRDQNPFDLFKEWLEKASETEPNDPEAMALATVRADGTPSVRMVLLKGASEKGFCFYTNMESNKGQELAARPAASLCFHWKTLQRQVRVWGRVEKLPMTLVEAYFATRHPLSRLGAWASAQSRPLESRNALLKKLDEVREKFKNGEDVPKPPYWGGYAVIPDAIEFWQAGDGRLHDRFLFSKSGDGWDLQRLNP